MTTQEERISALERDVENEQEWRRGIIQEMRAGFERMEARIERMEAKIDRLYIALIVGLLGVITAIVASNWLG